MGERANGSVKPVTSEYSGERGRWGRVLSRPGWGEGFCRLEGGGGEEVGPRCHEGHEAGMTNGARGWVVGSFRNRRDERRGAKDARGAQEGEREASIKRREWETGRDERAAVPMRKAPLMS